VNEKELLEKGYRKYNGNEIDVYFNLNMCQHSANCTKSNHRIFDTKRKPWIKIDNGNAQDIMNIIDKCPSKALRYIKK
jgi:uncharacterized Fe-S cluster protein YjdI